MKQNVITQKKLTNKNNSYQVYTYVKYKGVKYIPGVKRTLLTAHCSCTKTNANRRIIRYRLRYQFDPKYKDINVQKGQRANTSRQHTP